MEECHSNTKNNVALPGTLSIFSYFTEGFFEDQILQPSFYMPENEDLKMATHHNIRRTLFFSVFRNVKYVEF